jgi:hypothetical protein
MKCSGSGWLWGRLSTCAAIGNRRKLARVDNPRAGCHPAPLGLGKLTHYPILTHYPMKLAATSVLLAACCAGVLAVPACSLRAGRAVPTAAAAPKPAAPPAVVETAAELPISVPQTQVTLPSPQPIQAEALAVRPESQPTPDPANQPVRPQRNPAPARPEARPQATAQPAGPPAPPPAAPTVTRRRIRPLESPAERQRLLAGITARQKQVQDVLAKAKSRPLSEAEKSAADRIQGFLAQTESALKDDDLQQAEALSNRALLLCQELSSEK